MSAGRRLLLGGAALVAGLLLARALPASWLFVAPPEAAAAADDGVRWACPMFCVVLEDPGDGRCPVCGMELGPVRGGATLDAHERAQAGVAGERLERRPLVRPLRLFGELEVDERKLAEVAARSAGFVERLRVPETWTTVAAGDPLLDLYSPELYAAQQAYLTARERGGPALDAARERLELLGVDERDVAAIRAAGHPHRAVPVRASHGGVVVRTAATEGGYVAVGETLFTIATLDTLWLQLAAFEDELPWLAPGGTVRVDPGRPGLAPFDATVAFVDPVVDRATRTARVRVEVPNVRLADGRWALRPGERLEATARPAVGADGGPAAEAAPVLAVPRAALLSTGEREGVYVLYRELDDGGRDYDLDPDALPERIGYELVELRVGPRAQAADTERREQYFPVLGVVPPRDDAPGLRRLRPGLVVVSEGALLLDSQAQLAGRDALFTTTGGAPAGDPHAGH